jgi:iron complex outermembrane receptor protein
MTRAAASAQDQPLTLNLPAQPLTSSLKALSEEANLQMFYAAETVRGKTAPALSGAYTPRRAIQTLLAGTGLEHTFTAENAVAIKTAETEASPEAAPAEAKPKEDVVQLPEMTVTADPRQWEQSYNAYSASTATKTDTPIMETPASIQVVPRAIIDEQRAIRLEELTRFVSGVTTASDFGDLYDDYIIRGFSTNRQSYRNGIRFQWTSFETAHLDRVEFLKGPAAVLYGRAEPGGLVNIVTKKPLDTPYYSLQQQFGSYDLYRTTTVDATGPVTEDRSLLYRFNLAYTNKNSFQDFIETECVSLMPSLTWRPTAATELHLNFEYRDEDIVDDYGIPAIDGRPARVPISRFLGGKDQHTQRERTLVELTGSHAFNDDWKLQGQFVYYDSDYTYFELYPFGLRPNKRTFDLSLYDAIELYNAYAANMNTNGKFDLLGVRNNVLVGFDYYCFQFESEANYGAFAPVGAIDIFNPVYLVIPDGPPEFTALDEQEWYTGPISRPDHPLG